MSNPLRLPIVLLTVFTLLAAYVHTYHRRRAVLESAASSSSPLQLRQSADPMQPAAQPRSVASRPEFEQRMTHSFEPSAQPSDATPPGSPLPMPETSEVSPMARAESLTAPRAQLGAIIPQTSILRPNVGLQERAAPRETAAATDRAFAGEPNLLTLASANENGTDSIPMMHRVVDGDTLPQIAERYLGNAARYPEILEANRDVLRSADLLPLGVRLKIPAP